MSDHIPDAGKKVPAEWRRAFAAGMSEASGTQSITLDAMNRGIAAVAPLIRRVALEDAAKYHDEAADGERDLASQCGAQNDRRGNEIHKYLEQEHILSAAAIRALGDGR